MKDIYLLTDYKGRFGSKHYAKPYRSGMDKEIISQYFYESGYEARFLNFSKVDFRAMDFKNIPILYTSQEDWGYHYKSYIEDIVLGLELQGAQLIPSYKYLRANNNKVFMEILRDQLEDEGIKIIQSMHFGCLEELLVEIDKFDFPVVIKSAAGAMSTGVYLAKSRTELIKYAKKISRTKYYHKELKDIGRSIKHKGYSKESKFRSKFIVQNLIPGLKNDWKVYVMGDQFYIFKRPLLKGRGFRASGGGYGNYLYDENADFPEGIFDYAEKLHTIFNVPHLSLDIGFANGSFFLIEFQALYFGTAGILFSEYNYIKKGNEWQKMLNNKDIELSYVNSIAGFIR